MSRTPLMFIALLALFPVAVLGQETKPAPLSPLISVDELADAIRSEADGLRVLEPGQKLTEFKQGHIPGAAFIDWVDDMTDANNVASYRKPEQEQFEKLMSRLGVKRTDRIVIYDRLTNRLSTRLYWTLKYFGHEKVQVLDGGMPAWQAKFKLADDETEFRKSKYLVGDVQAEILSDMDTVKRLMKDSRTRLIDGRPPKQFSGEVVGRVFHTDKPHPRKGHIPGAVNVFWNDNFNEDGTFKSVEELRKLYRDSGIHADQNVVTYCNEGLHAAPPWFVLTQLLEFENVRLYDSSMAEWSKSDEPMTGDKN